MQHVWIPTSTQQLQKEILEATGKAAYGLGMRWKHGLILNTAGWDNGPYVRMSILVYKV